ncbi:thaumatin-like protein 1 [Phragmites australis]|uniref:thaumatin-like protein 1 n=1 Tax=Phragmites australis TaxID=29695 RepID=UPI002D773CB4|nr:thaumatin-like protein 1 [Phragmites australis]
MGLPRSITVLVLLFSVLWRKGEAATFTFVNRCTDTVWPGVLSNAGSPPLEPTGFELQPGGARAVPAPSGWSGRMWARTGCAQDGATGRLVCATGDCGSGASECAGAGAAPPATLAEFTLDGTGGLDFYDVSLVDGYNLPVLVEPSAPFSGAASCAAAGCAADLNAMCPAELRAGGGAACRSACDAFARPEYCCSGAFASPAACQPTAYSQVFKSACPRSYSYAFDDPTSTFTCGGSPDYTITFCPSATPSQKSTTLPGTTPTPTVMPGTTTTVPGATTAVPGTTPTSATPTGTMLPGTTFTDATPDNAMPMGGLGVEGGNEGGVLLGSSGAGGVSWLANMATGDVSAAPLVGSAKLVARLVAALLCLHFRLLLL